MKVRTGRSGVERWSIDMPNAKLGLLASAMLIVVLLSIGSGTRDYFIGDLFLTRMIQEVRIAWWEETMEIVSLIGAWPIMGVTASALIALLFWKGLILESLTVVGALPSFGLSWALKFLVHRHRPSDDLVWVWRDFEGLSFPSGHALTSIVVFGLLFYFAPLLVRWKWAVSFVRSSSLLLMLLIGVSRIYLGAHWTSDVVGGFFTGIVLLVLVIHFYRWQKTRVRALS